MSEFDITISKDMKKIYFCLNDFNEIKESFWLSIFENSSEILLILGSLSKLNSDIVKGGLSNFRLVTQLGPCNSKEFIFNLKK